MTTSTRILALAKGRGHNNRAESNVVLVQPFSGTPKKDEAPEDTRPSPAEGSTAQTSDPDSNDEADQEMSDSDEFQTGGSRACLYY